jgi:hypothetical protein
VLNDSILAWSSLEEERILIFDDYEWQYYEQNYHNPKLAIDSFLACYKPQLEIIHQGYQLAVKKKIS